MRRLLSRLLVGPPRLGWGAMPWLMRVGAWTSAFFTLLWSLIVPFAALNVGSYSIDHQVVTGPYFLVHEYPALLPFLVLGAAIAYGYWTERLWARILPIVFWVAVDCALAWQIFVGDVVGDEVIELIVWAVIYVAVALWYCLFKRSVERYYHALSVAYAGEQPVGGETIVE